MTPQRTKQAIEALSPEGISEQDVDGKISTHAESEDVHGLRMNTLAFGGGAQSKAYGVAIGQNTLADGQESISLGRNAQAKVPYSVAIGRGAVAGTGPDRPTAVGVRAITIGESASAT